ncbi:MAG: hypothetical protein EXR28_16560 [Betaproteobacteria bacterium]|nr:hypothetical protein [Betaproteobacteria bacterium]
MTRSRVATVGGSCTSDIALRVQVCIFFLLCVPLAPFPVIAQTQVVSISFAGTLNKAHVDQLRAAIAKMRGDPVPTGLIIVLDSIGGDGRAAIAMGRMARDNNAHIFVKGTCRSACVLLFAGGVYRDARAFAIGIHRGRVTRAVPGMGEVDIQPSTDSQARELLDFAEREAREYLQEMGVPRLFSAMQTVPSTQIRLLRSDEAADLGLLGFDPAYLEKQAAAMQMRYGINRQQLLERFARVRDRCEQDLGETSKFLACYRPAILKD